MELSYERTQRGRELAGAAFLAQGWVMKPHSDGVTFQVHRPGQGNWACLVRAVREHPASVPHQVRWPGDFVEATPLWAAAMWAWWHKDVTVADPNRRG
jgi:hypothetical protein